MISFDLDATTFDAALSRLEGALNRHVQAGLGATLEAIAARAKQTTTFVDRTSALRNSIRSEGVTGSYTSDDLEGSIGFAARSPAGYPYGVALEYGTRHIRERRFVRDAIDAELGGFLEDGLRRAFEAAGFEVVG